MIRSRLVPNARLSHAGHLNMRGFAALFGIMVAGACGGGDSSGPPGNGGPAVATVEVAGAGNTLGVGETMQLTATAKDGDGNVVTGRTFTWSSNNQAVATVVPSGLVTGVSAGPATISATADSRSGSYAITVQGAEPVVVASVTPNPLVPGQAATITGTGFSPVPQNNVVRIAGISVTVTAATATSLSVSVPASLCSGATATVSVQIGSQTSNPFQAPAQSAGTAVNLAVGEQVVLTNPSTYCLQFASSSNTEAYLVGVQSVSPTGSTVTAVTVGSVAGSSGPGVSSLPIPAAGGSALTTQATNIPVDQARFERWRRHRSNEAVYRDRELRQMAPYHAEMVNNVQARTRAAATAAGADAVTSAATIPGNVNVGDNLSVRVINRETNLCTQFATITAVVRAVGQYAIWLEDAANPTGGYTPADFQALAAQFDATLYPTDVEYFGEPSDLDANGRIAILVTKEVNKYDILGFVTSADYMATCQAGNNAEIFYAIAPDPNNTDEDAQYSLEDARRDAPVLLVHELVHIIQFTRRLAAGSPLSTTWELEGQATYAELVGGFEATGRSARQNYGFNTIFNCSEPPGQSCVTEIDPNDWFIFAFIDLLLYYGFDANCDVNTPGDCDIPLAGAPEQCTWLALEAGGPCIGGREVYGVPALLFMWLADQFGPTFAGGDAEVTRRLVDSNQTGFSTIAAVTGQPINVLLAEWAASLYVDDRITNPSARLASPSWNFFGFESRLRESAQLNPRERTFSTFNDNVQVRAGSTAYFRVSGAGRPATLLRVRGTGEAILPSNMQVWVVRMQ
jgi:hypothetical protein